MLWTILEVGLLAVTALVLVPTLVLFIEVLASLFSGREIAPVLVSTVRVAVLVPAHNESVGLIPTLSDVRRQLSSQDRLLVVADNCTDDTAAVARQQAAEVVERNDLSQIGKGYALDCGIQHLTADPPDVLFIVDADCRLGLSTIATLASISVTRQRPVQALNLMIAPEPASVTQRASEFAWRIKNQIRPLGLHTLNLPCQLMGTGMALPWKLLRKSSLATGLIVEDLNLGLELAAQGHPPIFCPQVRVTSLFPTSVQAATNQRSRWEHGHMHVLTSFGPKLLLKAIGRGDIRLLAQTLDLLVPPLALLGVINVTAMTFTGIAWLAGMGALPLLLAVSSFILMFVSVLMCWFSKGRDLLPASDLPSAFGYLAAKAGLYRRLLSGRRVSRWVRTDRDDR